MQSLNLLPEHFIRPDGIMTSRFEQGLEARIEQANPPTQLWPPSWKRNMLCER
jgi:hypothetical protein